MIKNVILSSVLVLSSFMAEAGVNGYFRLKENSITAFNVLPEKTNCTDSTDHKEADGNPTQLFSRSFTVNTDYGTFTYSTRLESGYGGGCKNAKSNAFNNLQSALQYFEKVNAGDFDIDVVDHVKLCSKQVIDILVEENIVTAVSGKKIFVKCP